MVSMQIIKGRDDEWFTHRNIGGSSCCELWALQLVGGKELWTRRTHCGCQGVCNVDREHFPRPTAVQGCQTEMEARRGLVRILAAAGKWTSDTLVCSLIEIAFKAILHPPVIFDTKLSDGRIYQVACEGDRVDRLFEGIHSYVMVLELVFPARNLRKVELKELFRLCSWSLRFPGQYFLETISEAHRERFAVKEEEERNGTKRQSCQG